MHKTVTGDNFWKAFKGKQQKETGCEKFSDVARTAEFLLTVLHNLPHKLLYCLLHLFMLMATHAVQIKAARESN